MYLAGPITGYTFDGCTEWRDYVKKNLPKHIHTYSPMRGKKGLKKYEGLILDTYEEEVLSSEKGISARDYNDVLNADILLVNFLGATRVSIGTVMEIAWAKAMSIPVVLVMEKEGNLHDHSMIRHACGFIVRSLEEAIEIIPIILGPDKALD